MNEADSKQCKPSIPKAIPPNNVESDPKAPTILSREPALMIAYGHGNMADAIQWNIMCL